MKATYQTILFAVSTAIAGCAQGDSDMAHHSSTPDVYSQNLNKPIGLAIHGFNYTDRVISMFSINNQGGGNIFVSSPTTGGGKTTCCMSWHSSLTLPRPVKIEWMRDIDGKEIWCKKEVMLRGPFPQHPKHVAVHFMPNGDIEAEITDHYPDPKLQLENYDDAHRKEKGNVIHDEETADCKYVH